MTGGDLFAYKVTGGSNLDLPDLAFTPEGTKVSLERDVYPKYDIILCISTFSATAPLTAFAKQHGFRGATLHGLNEMTGSVAGLLGVRHTLLLDGAAAVAVQGLLGRIWRRAAIPRPEGLAPAAAEAGPLR